MAPHCYSEPRVWDSGENQRDKLSCIFSAGYLDVQNEGSSCNCPSFLLGTWKSKMKLVVETVPNIMQFMLKKELPHFQVTS